MPPVDGDLSDPSRPSPAHLTREPDTMTLPLSASLVGPSHDESRSSPHPWLPILALGSASIGIGTLAIATPQVVTSAAVIVIAVLLVREGITEVIHAVVVRNWKGLAQHLFAAPLYLLVGQFILEDREQATSALTLLLAAAFIVGGLLRIAIAVVLRFAAWPWVVVNGLSQSGPFGPDSRGNRTRAALVGTGPRRRVD